MAVTIQREMERLEKRMTFLASTGSAAPFIGLFGTVWGIMNSFAAIAGMQNTSLAVVAPGIAEALFATAIGLVAAIPAVLIYNMLASQMGKFAGRMEGFASEFGAILARQTEAAAASAPRAAVMLVLLIIFMVAIPAATVSIKLDLPPAVPPPPGTKTEEPTVINIQNGGVFIGEAATTVERLPADLARKLNKPDPTKERVYIRANRDVRYGDFMRVMNTLQGNGYFQVALINEEL